MRTFKDTAGREWSIELNGDNMETVLSETGVLLFSIFEKDFKLALELSTDFIKTIKILCVLCREQFVTSGIAEKEFKAAIHGDVLYDATMALWRATIDFFPNPEGRSTMHQAIDQMVEASQIYIRAKGKEVLQELEPHRVAESCIAFSTNSQALPASIQDGAPLASSR